MSGRETADELSDRISRLEDEIDDLTEKLARCRKISLFSRTAIAMGGLAIIALLFGAIAFDPTVMVAAIAAVVGGTVLAGSNARSARDFAEALGEAEARRMELIGRIDLRIVGGKERIQ